jgi:hypothetical protein
VFVFHKAGNEGCRDIERGCKDDADCTRVSDRDGRKM